MEADLASYDLALLRTHSSVPPYTFITFVKPARARRLQAIEER